MSLGAVMLLGAGAAAAQTPIYLSADGRASINPDFADSPPVASDPDYGKVLVAPDDVEFNLAYARSRASAGDLVGAAAALERLLLNRPNWHAARLFYAAVLIRLDDLQAARRELALLKDVQLTPEQTAEVAKYTRQSERRDAGSRLSGQVALGVAYDSNAVGSLANAVNLGAGIPIEDDGLSVVASASLSGATRIGSGAELFAQISGLSKSDVSGPDQRYVRGDAQIGVGFAAGGVGVRVAAVARDVSIFGDHYQFDYGGRVELSRRLGTRTALNASLEVVDQDYDNAGFALPGLGDGRDGTRIDGSIGISTRLTARQTLSFEVGYDDKDADYLPFAYRGPHASAAYAALLGRGGYASLSAQVRRYNYRAADLLISPVKRRDTRSFFRAALGAPLSAFTASGVTSDFRERLLLEGAINYNRRDARLPYLDYDSVGAETRLIYRFGG
ncbi:surface lipoprotein assembly modifier [Glacieibacterium frigidum]|uniref:surface lipoprotein assembly modifier n=1 Tax=Glacieibacterium frigidum TaxID=2593303 RepID=UPI00163D6190|nr:surface lipoprotein assembly modifier [Glacieibacterium frigidum]